MDISVTQKNISTLESILISRVQFLAKDENLPWHLLKSKNGMNLFKLIGVSEPDIYRGSMNLNYEVSRVVKVFSLFSLFSFFPFIFHIPILMKKSNKTKDSIKC